MVIDVDGILMNYKQRNIYCILSFFIFFLTVSWTFIWRIKKEERTRIRRGHVHILSIRVDLRETLRSISTMISIIWFSFKKKNVAKIIIHIYRYLTISINIKTIAIPPTCLLYFFLIDFIHLNRCLVKADFLLRLIQPLYLYIKRIVVHSTIKSISFIFFICFFFLGSCLVTDKMKLNSYFIHLNYQRMSIYYCCCGVNKTKQEKRAL